MGMNQTETTKFKRGPGGGGEAPPPPTLENCYVTANENY